jgi:hypothetical protein
MGAMGWITYPELQPDPEHPSCGWVKVRGPGNRAQGCLSGARRGSRIRSKTGFYRRKEQGRSERFVDGRQKGRKEEKQRLKAYSFSAAMIALMSSFGEQPLLRHRLAPAP